MLTIFLAIGAIIVPENTNKAPEIKLELSFIIQEGAIPKLNIELNIKENAYPTNIPNKAAGKTPIHFKQLMILFIIISYFIVCTLILNLTNAIALTEASGKSFDW